LGIPVSTLSHHLENVKNEDLVRVKREGTYLWYSANTELKEVVKEKYGQAALRVNAGGSSCCGASAALDGCCDPITSNLYDATQTGGLPQEAVLASLGCGNPTALAQLNAGETVLDLGFGRRY
jgi:hypothetical protein